MSNGRFGIFACAPALTASAAAQSTRLADTKSSNAMVYHGKLVGVTASTATAYRRETLGPLIVSTRRKSV